MRTRDREIATLGKAEADIVAGEQRITEQFARIEQLRAGGHDVTRAEEVLAVYEANLKEWRTHRARILQRIAEIDARERVSSGEGC